MKKQTKANELNEAIFILESRQGLEHKMLKDQFHLTYEALKPGNLIRHALQEVTRSPEIRKNMLKNVIGLGTGYLSNRFLVGKSVNPVRKILGLLLQLVVTRVITKRAAKEDTAKPS